MENYAYIQSPRSADDWVELARDQRSRGRLFRKHILNLGPLYHPKTGEKLDLDDRFYNRLHDNFVNGACDIVQVPLADDQNQHSEDPARNLGEVVDIQREGNKVFAVMDIRKDADAIGKTLLGASAFLSMDYTDTATNKKVGPTLLHTAITNRPYVTHLDPFAEVLAATNADTSSDGIVLLSQEAEVPATKEELIAGLKEHGIDVEALQAAATSQPDTAALTAALTKALEPAGTVKLSNGKGEDEISLTDIVGAVAELAQTNGTLAASVVGLQKKDASREIDGYVKDGRVLPKQRDSYVELALTNRDLLDSLLPDEPVVKLNHQAGVTPPDDKKKQEDLDAEIIRLTTSEDPKVKKYFDPEAANYAR